MTTNAFAANAYAALARVGDAMPKAGGLPAPAAKEAGFADLVREAVESVAETGANADNQTRQLMQGKADLVDVVTAVAESELALDTLVSVRDRMIAAYEEIMRMPI